MRALRVWLGLVCAGMLAGCGGGGTESQPGTPDAIPDQVSVGPFVMHSAAASSMQIESLPDSYGAAFAVFSGVTIDYVAVREVMDRVVFVSTRSGAWQLHTCDFFGDNPTQITFNDRVDSSPAWSPDGSKLAWTYHTATMGSEILVRAADGGPATHLTNNPAEDLNPTWSPDGRWIAFETNRDVYWHIYKMLSDGSEQTPLTSGSSPPCEDVEPDWSPDGREILFMSNRIFPHKVWIMDSDGTNQQCLSMDGRQPAWHPDSNRFALRNYIDTSLSGEIFTAQKSSAAVELFASGPDDDSSPCYSTDGRYLFFVSQRSGVSRIYAKQTSFPYRLHQIAASPGMAVDRDPDVGSPTVQISRVLIGPAGSDHGYDPIHNAAVAGVVAFSHNGYLNFVRLGIPPASGTGLTVTPLRDTGAQLVGAILSGPDMYYIEEDAGIGMDPTMWNFTGAPIRTAVLYLDALTGKLVTVIDMGDSIHTAFTAVSAAAITHDESGPGTSIRGQFRRVYDTNGGLIAEGEIGTVQIDAANRVARAF